MVVTGGPTGRWHGDGRRIMSRFVSLSHTLHRWGTCTKRRGARTAHVLPYLSQPHPRGYTVELSFVRKGSPRGNLTRVLVLHLMEDCLPRVNKQVATCRVMLKKRQAMWGLPRRQGSIHWRCPVRITFDVSCQLAK